jgi:hypothetical protein
MRHMNAIFLTDANALLPKVGLSPVEQALQHLTVQLQDQTP